MRSSFALRGLKFIEFAEIFRENLTRRSRTAKGVSDTSSSSSKKPLLKSGGELRRQVEENTTFLITNAWDRGQNQPTDPTSLRQMMELWYDIINKDLQDPNAYKKAFAELESEAARLSGETGRPWKVNHRYRTWTISYTRMNLNPIDLEFAMESFYRTLFEKIRLAKAGRLGQAELLAFADHMIDGQIHPWADGCGRCSTSAVMWLSLLVPEPKLPVFRERETHYATMRDLKAHTEYFRKCLM